MNNIKGFTLIELLFSLFIFVITMIIAVYGLLQLTKHTDSYHKRESALIELHNAIIVIQFDFMQTIQRYRLNNQNQIEPVFLGKKNEVVFNKIGYYNEQVHYYQKETALYRNDQLILSDLLNLEINYIDNKGKLYEIWPPTQDWAYIQPSGIKLSVDSKYFGKIEKWAKISNE